MFTWICPKCGREVPPAYDECPDCSAKTAAEADASATAPPQQPQAPPPPPPPVAAARPPLPPEYAPPVHQPAQPYYPPQPAPPPYRPQPAYPPPPQPGFGQVYSRPYDAPPPPPAHSGLPTWLMTLVFALAFVGLGAGIYWIIGYMRGTSTAAPPPVVENPAAKAGAKNSPFQKFIEISGVRFTPDPKNKSKTVVQFVITNHSGADASGLAGNVTLWGRTQKSEEDPTGSFAFTTNLGPYESKELSAPLTTKLKIYELPDWQNVSADIQITSPAASGG